MRGAIGLFVHTPYWCPEGQLRGATQKFGEFSHKNVSYVTPSFHRLLRSSPLGHVYSDPSVFPTLSCIPGSSQMLVCR